MERTPEQMRAYLDRVHIPDPEQAASYAELWLIMHAERVEDPDERLVLEALSEEAKQAYIDEHLQVCAWCGETREWHNHHATPDHNFDPNERVPT